MVSIEFPYWLETEMCIKASGTVFTSCIAVGGSEVDWEGPGSGDWKLTG